MKIDTQCILLRSCYSTAAAIPFSTESDNDESKKNPWIDFVCPRGIKQTTFGRKSLSSSQMTTKAQKQSNFLVLQPPKIYLSAASKTTRKDTHQLIRSLLEGKECLLWKVMSDAPNGASTSNENNSCIRSSPLWDNRLVTHSRYVAFFTLWAIIHYYGITLFTNSALHQIISGRMRRLFLIAANVLSEFSFFFIISGKKKKWFTKKRSVCVRNCHWLLLCKCVCVIREKKCSPSKNHTTTNTANHRRNTEKAHYNYIAKQASHRLNILHYSLSITHEKNID